MTLILRKIHKRLWEIDTQPGWLGSGEVQADVFTSRDLWTEDNKLSVWEIENDKSNLDQVVAAMASNCDDIANFDYVLFDEKLISKLRITIDSAEGDSLDPYANKTWHRHLIELSGIKLLKLARAMLHKRNETKRILPKKVEEKIAKSNDAGRLDLARMSGKIMARLERLKTERE